MDKITIAVGRSRMDLGWELRDVTWDQMAERLSKAVRTSETMETYSHLGKASRANIKDVGGFVGARLTAGNGRRSNQTVEGHTLVTIDIDGEGARHPRVEDVEKALEGYAYVLHSTHSSTPAAPRLRVVMPLTRETTNDEYAPVCLRICELIGIDLVDVTCAQRARLMFWPSVCSDAEYIYRRHEGGPADPDTILATYVDWRDAAEWPGARAGLRQAQHRRGVTDDQLNGRVEDPTGKQGIVGAFCRVFSVDDAIREFGLPYREAGRSRYTFTGGSTYGGACVYGGGRWLYSNHATDPAGGQLCNAFDLVRLHLFAPLDIGQSPDTPANRMKSYVAMSRRAEEIREVKAEWAKMSERRAAEELASAPATAEGGSPEDILPDPAGPEKREDDWRASMDMRGKAPMASPNNFALILEHDENISGKIRYNEFADRKEVCGSLPWESQGERLPRRWTDADNAGLSNYLSTVYQIHTGDSAQRAAVTLYMSRHRVHPVREWLDSLPEWDGTPRLETCLIRYLGAEDTRINRTMTRKHFTGGVARIYHPGVKYDQCLVLFGREGIGKSSFIEKMANGWYNGSMIPVGEKDAYQNLVGSWLVEMPELADYETKSVALYKSFISSSSDTYRPAYAAESIDVPRQCIFFATTNEPNFLKGRTGNRRFWVVDCYGGDEEGIFGGKLASEMPLLWAEAKYYYMHNEALVIDTAEEAAMLRDTQKMHESILSDDNIRIIEEFARKEKPMDWTSYTLYERKAWYRGESVRGTFQGEEETNTRITPTCVKEVSMVVFDRKPDASKSRFDDENVRYMMDNMPCLRKTGNPMRFGMEIGIQKAYEYVGDSCNEDNRTL